MAYFACCGRRTAWIQDVYPDEIESHAEELRRDGLLVGLYPTAGQAWEAAEAALLKRTRQ